MSMIHRHMKFHMPHFQSVTATKQKTRNIVRGCNVVYIIGRGENFFKDIYPHRKRDPLSSLSSTPNGRVIRHPLDSTPLQQWSIWSCINKKHFTSMFCPPVCMSLCCSFQPTLRSQLSVTIWTIHAAIDQWSYDQYMIIIRWLILWWWWWWLDVLYDLG